MLIKNYKISVNIFNVFLLSCHFFCLALHHFFVKKKLLKPDCQADRWGSILIHPELISGWGIWKLWPKWAIHVEKWHQKFYFYRELQRMCVLNKPHKQIHVLFSVFLNVNIKEGWFMCVALSFAAQSSASSRFKLMIIMSASGKVLLTSGFLIQSWRSREPT